jgi:hypothetical protein
VAIEDDPTDPGGRGDVVEAGIGKPGGGLGALFS